MLYRLSANTTLSKVVCLPNCNTTSLAFYRGVDGRKDWCEEQKVSNDEDESIIKRGNGRGTESLHEWTVLGTWAGYAHAKFA